MFTDYRFIHSATRLDIDSRIERIERVVATLCATAFVSLRKFSAHVEQLRRHVDLLAPSSRYGHINRHCSVFCASFTRRKYVSRENKYRECREGRSAIVGKYGECIIFG